MEVCDRLRANADVAFVTVATQIALERGHTASCLALLPAHPELKDYPNEMPLPVHAAATLNMERVARQMLLGPDLRPEEVDALGFQYET